MVKTQKKPAAPPPQSAPPTVEQANARMETVRREVVDVLQKHKVVLPEFFYLIELIKFDSLSAIRAKGAEARARAQEQQPPLTGKETMYR